MTENATVHVLWAIGLLVLSGLALIVSACAVEADDGEDER